VLFKDILVVIRGGGDLASGVIYRLHKAGFPIVITELSIPLLVRRTVSYGEAAISGKITVEGITAQRFENPPTPVLPDSIIPLVCDDSKHIIHQLKPVVVIDGRMMKHNPDTTLHDAPLVIALGPGYTAGQDCHAVIETNRGHFLGRVIWHGCAEADTGEPGVVQGKTHSRVLRAPVDGFVQPLKQIGDFILKGDIIATVQDHPVYANFDGILRGLVNSQLYVTAGTKIGDLDPRAKRENCFTISEKSLAIGGGVLEAILSAPQIRRRFITSNPSITTR